MAYFPHQPHPRAAAHVSRDLLAAGGVETFAEGGTRAVPEWPTRQRRNIFTRASARETAAAPPAPSAPPAAAATPRQMTDAAGAGAPVPATVWAPPAHAVGPGWRAVGSRPGAPLVPAAWGPLVGHDRSPHRPHHCRHRARRRRRSGPHWSTPPPLLLHPPPTPWLRRPRSGRRRSPAAGTRPEPTSDAAAAPDGPPQSVDLVFADLTDTAGAPIDGRLGMLAAGMLRGGGILAVLTRCPPHRRRRLGGRDRRDRRVGPERGPALPATHCHPGPTSPAGPRDRCRRHQAPDLSTVHEVAHVDLLVFARPRTGNTHAESGTAARRGRTTTAGVPSSVVVADASRRGPPMTALDAPRRGGGGVGVGDRAAHPGRAAPRPLRAGVDGAPGEDAARGRRARHHHLHPPRASWCWTRCAGSAPPSSKPSTRTAARSGWSTRPRWAEIARANIDHTGPLRRGPGPRVHRRRPAPGLAAPARPARPGGAGGHLAARTGPPPTAGSPPTATGVHKRHHLYGDLLDRGNLANIGHHRLLAGFTRILTLTAPYLRPGGRVVITVRPWREHAELIDLPAQIAACGRAAGLVPVERCVALLGRVTEHRRVRGAGLVLPTRLHPPPTRPRPAPAPDRPRGRHRPGPTSFPGVRTPPQPRPQPRPRVLEQGRPRRAVHSPDRACGCPTRHGFEPVTTVPATRRGRPIEHAGLLV